MRKIDADKLKEAIRFWHIPDEELVMRTIDDEPTIEADTICEVNLEENAALVCEILNADAEGKVWRPLTDEDIEEML